MRRVWVLLAVLSALAPTALHPALAGEAEEPLLDLIVWFDEDAKDEGLAKLVTMGVVGQRAAVLPAARVLATREQAEAIAAMPEVDGVYPNERVELYSAESNDAIGVPAARELSARGAGAVAMTIDTGVDGTHPDLLYGVDVLATAAAVDNFEKGLPVAWTETAGPSNDWHGHGTHTLGILGGRGRGGTSELAGTYEGVAPEAGLVAFSFTGLAPGDRATAWGGLAGFDYAIAHRESLGIDVVSNSWGLAGRFFPDHPINRATKAAYESGIVVVFAAGNDGDNIGSRSLNAYCVAPWVLCVGATTVGGELASFSSYGIDPAYTGDAWDHPDLVAPGVDVRAPRTHTEGGSLLTGRSPSWTSEIVLEGVAPADAIHYSTKSGTSMACPHVAGVAALVLGVNPRLSPDEVHRILVASARKMPTDSHLKVGAGFLDAGAAVELALATVGSLDVFLAGERAFDGGDDDPTLARDAFQEIVDPRMPRLVEERDAGTGADAPDDAEAPLAVSDGVHLGAITPVGDVDRYAFDVAKGKRMEVHLKPLDGDLNLQILDGAGRVVASSANILTALDFVVVGEGAYVMRVVAALQPRPLVQPSDPAPPHEGRYAFALVSAHEPKQDDAGTGGDLPDVLGAGHLLAPGAYKGVLSPLDRGDGYSIEVPARTRVTITLTSPATGEFHLRYRFTDPTTLVRVTGGAERSEGRSESVDFVTYGPETFDIRAFQQHGQGTYRLEVTFEPAEPTEIDGRVVHLG